MSTATRRRLVVVAILVGGVIGLNLLATGLDRAVGGNQPGGVSDSSYATGGEGVAAYAQLLSDYGYGVSQQRGAITDHPPVSDATMVVLQPSTLTEADTAALLQFVTAGGRLVIGGTDPFYLHRLRDHPPTWSPNGSSPWTAISGLGAVRTVATASEGAWIAPGTSQVLVGDNERALLTHEAVGRGDMYFLADPSALQNAYLGQDDNAAFALAIAGPSSRPVVFAEGVHGYGESRGFAAIPARWKVGLALLGLAAIAFIWSRARRFGPPDRAARDLPPARAEYVRSLSTTLERTHDPRRALEPVRGYVRGRVAARAALRPDAGDDDIVRAARRLGCTDDEVAALLAPPVDDASALALGRALARVGEHDGSIE
jgi:hypothetical protein